MANIVKQLADNGLINPPAWLPTNTMYLSIVGSHAYGVADTSDRNKIPDYDVYGFTIPPKHMIFKHLAGYIDGFGDPPQGFKHFLDPSVIDIDAVGGKGKQWDLHIFNIVKFFELCRQNNPNMIDALFTPENCVIHCTEIGSMVRDNRRLFLSKECWKKFRGYAYSTLKQADNCMKSKEIQNILKFEKKYKIDRNTTFKNVKDELAKRNLIQENEKQENENDILRHLSNRALIVYHKLYSHGNNLSKRFEGRKIRGQDSKFLYHIVRLFDEVEQIMLEGDLNLQRAKEIMKAIRRGEWSTDDVRNWAMEKDKALEAAYIACKLPVHAPQEQLRLLLLNCLESHYGSLENVVGQMGWSEQVLRSIDDIINQSRSKLYGRRNDN